MPQATKLTPGLKAAYDKVKAVMKTDPELTLKEAAKKADVHVSYYNLARRLVEGPQRSVRKNKPKLKAVKGPKKKYNKRAKQAPIAIAFDGNAPIVTSGKPVFVIAGTPEDVTKVMGSMFKTS